MIRRNNMCAFLSCVSTGNGKPLYFDWKLRQKVLRGEIKVQSADSHTSIADYFGFKAEKEDTLNKYEYNPFTKVFQIDMLNAKDEEGHILDDSKEIKDWY